jgi:hypothetical protein
MCKHFSYKKFALVYSTDAYGTKCSFEVTANEFCPDLTVLATITFAPGITDFSSVIAAAVEAGAQVFAFFMSSKNAAQLLEQGHAKGLFREGTQIFFTEQMIGAGT